MDFFAMLWRSGGIDAMARQVGVPPAKAMAGVRALLPPLLDGFRQYRGGMPELLAVLDELGGGSLAAAVMSVDSVDPAGGEALLARIAGSAEIRRGLADACKTGGRDPAALEAMLPLLAMLIGGYVAARAEGVGANEAELETIFDAPDSGDPAGDDVAPA